MTPSLTLFVDMMKANVVRSMLRNIWILLGLATPFTVVSCTGEQDIAERLGIDGIWEAALIQKTGAPGPLEQKGQVMFKGHRFTYTWYHLMKNSSGSAGDWAPVALEMGNINNTRSGAIELVADAYGTFRNNRGARLRQKPNIMEPSKNDYLIQYKVHGSTLVWMEDNNLDGDFDDVDEFPETITYTRVIE